MKYYCNFINLFLQLLKQKFREITQLYLYAVLIFFYLLHRVLLLRFNIFTFPLNREHGEGKDVMYKCNVEHCRFETKHPKSLKSHMKGKKKSHVHI